MLYSVVGSGIGVFALAANLMPELNEQIQLVQLPDEVSSNHMMTIIDLFISVSIQARVLRPWRLRCNLCH